MESSFFLFKKQFDINNTIDDQLSEKDIHHLLYDVFSKTLIEKAKLMEKIKSSHSEDEKIKHEVHLFLTGEFREEDMLILNKMIACDLFEMIYFHLLLIKKIESNNPSITVLPRDVMFVVDNNINDMVKYVFKHQNTSKRVKDFLKSYQEDYLMNFSPEEQEKQHQTIVTLISEGIEHDI